METIEISALDKKIGKITKAYSKEVEQSISKRLLDTADEILKYIKSHAPRSGRTNALADSFIKETYGSGSKTFIVIYSKTKGSIVHLIELGFKHRSGKFVRARPFLRPAYDTFTPKMLDDIKEIIKRGG